jgi:molybdopterin-guanine dinucleotide biosynthesis protein A
MIDTTLAILAGGESRRMGRPKAELRVGDRPILEYLLRRFTWDGPTMLVTAPGRERPSGGEKFDREVSDPPGAKVGPMRGVLTALQHAATPHVIITPLDMPLVRREQFDILLGALRDRPEVSGVMWRRLVDQSDEIEPFPCALRSGAAETISRQLELHRRSMRALAHLPQFMTIELPVEIPDEVWTNLNEPEDAERFLHDVSRTPT